MSKRIFIWTGCHSDTAHSFIKFCWEYNYLLICVPPQLEDYSFISDLCAGEITICGQDIESTLETLEAYPRNGAQTIDAAIGFFIPDPKLKLRLVMLSKQQITDLLFVYQDPTLKKIYCNAQPYQVLGLLMGYIFSIINRIRFVALDPGFDNADYLNDIDNTTLMVTTHETLRAEIQQLHVRTLMDAICSPYLKTLNSETRSTPKPL